MAGPVYVAIFVVIATCLIYQAYWSAVRNLDELNSVSDLLNKSDTELAVVDCSGRLNLAHVVEKAQQFKSDALINDNGTTYVCIPRKDKTFIIELG